MFQFVPGQRWGSESEPELGLGTIISVENRTIVIAFDLSNVNRIYATDTAPLIRVLFQIGDNLRLKNGQEFVVQSTSLKNDICFYTDANGNEISEVLLADNLQFTGAFERLKALQLDSLDKSLLREKALKLRSRALTSVVAGFCGARIDAIAHQLYIASEIANRPQPRVMLADEVGLGKTIEACLILHKLLNARRINRALILVPDALVYQWFVELLRKFNLHFHIVEPESYALYDGTLENNPFNNHQLVLAGINFACESGWSRELAAADWDLLIVDEAHHLQWSAAVVGEDYKLVERISQRCEGLLLLTATPEQLGVESHFARLRLLDPQRFNSFEKFLEDNIHYQDTAKEVKGLLKQGLSPDDDKVKSLLDGHGPGRVIFRNTRKVVTGFPERSLTMVELAANEEQLIAVNEEFNFDCNFSSDEPFYELIDDPRIDYLAQFLAETVNQKVLLICRSMAKAIAIEEALLTKINVKTALFHEDLTLLQRDRNAAYFANPEGARILICSEIGSEGRNFQFSEHLVLFDLPYNLELLEQRIGRLDRIGRKSTVSIIVPFVADSLYAHLTRWYHYGLDCFEHNNEYGNSLDELFKQFNTLIDKKITTKKLESFIKKSRDFTTKLVKKFEEGRDELLELTSFNAEKAAALVSEFEKNDNDQELEDFVYKAFDCFGIRYEDGHDGTIILSADDNYTIDLPEFNSEGATITFKREVALSREDVQFLSWDHPLVCSILEMFCATPLGNSSFAYQKRNDASREIILETLYCFEAIAPEHLHINRFLPPSPIKAVYNHLLEESYSLVEKEDFYTELRRGNPQRVIGNGAIREKVIPAMIEKSFKYASKKAEIIRKEVLDKLEIVAKNEINRLKYLQKINPAVSLEEIQLVKLEYDMIKKFISEASVRLDMLRLIYCGDKLK